MGGTKLHRLSSILRSAVGRVRPRLLAEETFLGREWWGEGRGGGGGNDTELTTDTQEQAGKM